MTPTGARPLLDISAYAEAYLPTCPAVRGLLGSSLPRKLIDAAAEDDHPIILDGAPLR